jgi:glycosyltransferase involved in cell wall biosynthesis
MNILLINKFLYPKGGDAISTLTTGELLKSKGHNVMFWGMEHPSNLANDPHNLFISNIDFNAGFSLTKQVKLAMNMLYSFEAKNKITDLVKKFKPDIVHLNNFAHQISPSVLDVFKQRQIPAVMTMRDYKMVCPVYTMLLNNRPCDKCANANYIHCLLNKCTKSSLAKSLLNTTEMYLHHRVLHIYDAIHTYISPSSFLMTKCQEMGFNHRMAHLPNFVNLDSFAPDYTSHGARAVYFGRLSQEKGISTLLHAFKGLDAHLDIIGDGPSSDAVSQEARSHKIDNVQFWGHLTGASLHDKIKASSVVIIPSEWYENNPRSVIEAFALGKPVIGANIGGIPELVKDNITGFTFTPWDAADLRTKITSLFANLDVAVEMGRNGRKLVETELSAENHYLKLMEIYIEAISAYH